MVGLLAEKVALITGAGSGIGRSAACLFAREGAKVMVADVDEAGGAGPLSTPPRLPGWRGRRICPPMSLPNMRLWV